MRPLHDATYRLERRILGPEHATVHAQQRAIKAQLRTAAGRRALQRRLRRVLASAPRARAAAALPATPAAGGSWVAPFGLPVFAINSILLPTGKVLLFAYPFQDEGGERNLTRNWATAWLWDPSRGNGATAFSRVDPPVDPRTGRPVNIWCSGASLLANGSVLVTGGNLEYANGVTYYRGLSHVYTFDPFAERWHRQPDMRHGRWYPTQTLLPNGDTLITSGLSEQGGTPTTGETDLDVEVFHPPARPDGIGTIELLGTRVAEGQTATPGVTGPPDGGLYPHAFTMPSGDLLVLGPYSSDGAPDRWRLRPPYTDLRNWSWIPGDPQDSPAGGFRYAGTAVLMPAGAGAATTRVMSIGGGGDPAKATASIFDETTSGWTAAGALNIGRAHANTVLLPDGSMVTVGGGTNTADGLGQWATTPDQRRIEVWDPASGTWGLGPAQQEARAYHSTALMLPDGSVLSAGDDVNPYFTGTTGGGTQWDAATTTDAGVRGDTGEVYLPRYLFGAGGQAAARPIITAAPQAVPHGVPFTVQATPGASRVVLMAPSAVTHSNDMSQRRLELAVTGSSGGTLTAVAPGNGAIAPPGYYMLFVVDAAGVPSVARWIKLGDTRSDLPAVGAGAGGSVPAPARAVVPAARPAPTRPAAARLTTSAARSAAQRELTRRVRGFARGRGRTVTCRATAARTATCIARWRQGGRRMTRRVRVTRTAAGRVVATILR